MDTTTVSEVAILEPGECAWVAPTKINPHSVKFISMGLLFATDNGCGDLLVYAHNPFDYVEIDYKGEIRYKSQVRVQVEYCHDVDYVSSPPVYRGKRVQCQNCGAPKQAHKCFYCRNYL